MARKKRSPLSGSLLIIFLIIAGLSIWSSLRNWQEMSATVPAPSETQDEADVYDVSGLNDEIDDMDLFNLKKQILETSTAAGKLESAMNSVVTIKSPWAEGYGFFISNRGHILTSKSLVSYEKDENDPIWREQQRLTITLERLNKTIEDLDNKLSYNRLSERAITKTEELLEKKKEEAEAVEEELDEYDSDIEVLAIDGTVLDITYLNESEYYDVALLTVENIHSPALKPVAFWPAKQFFRDILDSRVKVYSIGNEPGKTISINRSIIFKLKNEKKCCYSLQHKDVFDFASTGAPLLNEQGEVLGLCNAKNYRGDAVPILTILDDFKENLGLGYDE